MKPGGSPKRAEKQRLKKQLEAADQELAKLEAASALFAQVKARKKRIERLVLGGAVSFLVVVILAVWFTDGLVMTKTLRVLRRIEGADANPSLSAVTNCLDPRNRSRPYCQNRLAERESTWRGITRFGGTENAFTLHGREQPD